VGIGAPIERRAAMDEAHVGLSELQGTRERGPILPWSPSARRDGQSTFRKGGSLENEDRSKSESSVKTDRSQTDVKADRPTLHLSPNVAAHASR